MIKQTNGVPILWRSVSQARVKREAAANELKLAETTAKASASSFRAVVLIGVAAAFIPHITKPCVTSKLAKVKSVASPPQWLPVLLATNNPAPPPMPPPSPPSPTEETKPSPSPPPPAPPTCVVDDASNQCACEAGFKLKKKWDVKCCADTAGSTCRKSTSCCEEKAFDIQPPPPPPSPKIPPPMPPPAPPPCMDAEEMWDCISTCHSSDNGQKTSCKDKCNRCPASPSPPPSPVPSPPPMPPPAPPTCVENDPTNQCKCGPFQELTKIWDPNCCVFTAGPTCPASTPGSASCCTNLDLLPPPSPPPSPKISPPPPSASPSPPPSASPPPPSPAATCKDNDPEFCEENLPTAKDKIP